MVEASAHNQSVSQPYAETCVWVSTTMPPRNLYHRNHAELGTTQQNIMNCHADVRHDDNAFLQLCGAGGGTDLGEYRQDWAKVGAWVNELQSDKVLHDGFVVPVDEVTDGLHHAKLDVVINLGDQAKVQDGQAAIRGPDQVAGVGVSLHA